MAKYGSSSFSVLLIGGISMLASKVKNVTRKVENILESSHGLGDSWEESSPVGMARGTFTQDGGFFDDAVGGMHLSLRSAASTSRVGCVASAGNTLGQVFTGFLGKLLTAYEVLGQMGGLTKANAQYGVSGNVDEGVILQVHAPLTVTTTGVGVDNLAASVSGGAAYLQVSAYSGFTSVACKVQHSTDNSVWADLATFTAVTAAPVGERVAIAGTINRYTRSVVTVTGSGSITPFIGVARN
jgi:hypothetical protein